MTNHRPGYPTSPPAAPAPTGIARPSARRRRPPRAALRGTGVRTALRGAGLRAALPGVAGPGDAPSGTGPGAVPSGSFLPGAASPGTAPRVVRFGVAPRGIARAGTPRSRAPDAGPRRRQPASAACPGARRGAACRGLHGRRRGGERGSASIEFIGFLPILLLVALAAVQLGIAAYALQQAGTAARAAARTGSLDDPRTSPAAAGLEAISGWLADGASISGGGCGDGEAHATAIVEIPSVIPGFDFGNAEKSATMPCDRGDAAGPAAMGGQR